MLYGLCLTLFAAYKLFEIYNPAIPFLHTHLEDILALPIILKSALLTIHVLLPKYRHYVIPLRDSLFILVAFSLYYELYLPAMDPRFTADIWDVLCYVAGLFIFELWMNESPNGTGKDFTWHPWQK